MQRYFSPYILTTSMIALTAIQPGFCLNRFEQLIHDAQVHMLKMNTRSQAMDEVNQAIKLNPQSAVAWTTKAQLLHDLEDDEEGLLLVNKALAISPNFLPALATKADILLFLKRYPEALAVSNQVTKVSSQPGFVVTRANILRHLGRTTEAYKEMTALIKTHPLEFAALTLHSDLAEKLGDFNTVIADRTILIKSAASFSRMNHLQIRARAYMKLKKYDPAIGDLKAAIKDYPDLRELHSLLADAYHAAGKTGLEMQERRKMQEIDADLIQ